MLPAGKSPLEKETWAVVIDFDDSGYVKDDDAGQEQGARDARRINTGDL
jgi:uncharacterized membrane-anchored protein